tara:strand:- start:62373 stop:62627 length:255 start_codon:yes stop_codon:yes gene_type:complete
MVKETITYPIYRKYEGNRSYFRINSENSFTEIQLMGESLFLHEIEAKILPDFQLIADMVNLHNNHWVASNQDEFNTVYSLCKRS